MELDDEPAPRDRMKSGDSSNGDEEPGDGDTRDCMAPPEVPCECYCLHCGRVFMSDGIWFQRVIGARDGFDGFWMCPTPNCSGAGFTFDIFPTDPDHPANAGWVSFDDEEGEEEWDSEIDLPADDTKPVAEYDPDEPYYTALDEMEDDDIEGEEWKHGLPPGEQAAVEPPPPGMEPRNQTEEEALYNAPDRRPRELDWSNRPDPPASSKGVEGWDDDIPF